MKRLSDLPFLPAFLIAITTLPYTSCHLANDANPEAQGVLVATTAQQNDFAKYWYKGLAEVSSYAVEQSRYGETRNAEQVMVFVAEDFSKSKHVKLDNPEEGWKDKVSVLKLNCIRRFKTGIYDYSLMQSVFSPIDWKEYPHSLKTTATVQDWCGQTYLQFNLDGRNYRLQGFSYFENEADQDSKISAALLEDELWTRLRIDPKSIPTGNVDVIPGAFYARLQHDPLKPKKARIRLENRESMSWLILEYLHLDRTLSIGFEPAFPYKILSWTEQKGKEVISKGELKSSIKSAYWTQNAAKFEYLRDSLELQ